MMIPQFNFDHAVFMLTESQLSAEGLVYAYQKIVNFLQLRSRQELGLTVIITPNWIFVAVLVGPYMNGNNDVPVYLDGLAYCGLVNLQSVEAVCPETALGTNEQLKVTESIKKSTDCGDQGLLNKMVF